jgi:RimJ/RimL family protein N-acetyltransferase
VTEFFLSGEFINLRALNTNDAEATFKWRKSQRAKFLNSGASTLEQQRLWIAARPSSEFNFIIELKRKSAAVGMISLTNIDKENLHAEPGRFLIGEEDLVRGIPAAVEAVKLIYEFAFYELGLIRLYGVIAANNLLMIKWHKYMGMKVEGQLRNHLKQGDIFRDGILIGLLVEDFQKVTLPRANLLIALARKNLI